MSVRFTHALGERSRGATAFRCTCCAGETPEKQGLCCYIRVYRYVQTQKKASMARAAAHALNHLRVWLMYTVFMQLFFMGRGSSKRYSGAIFFQQQTVVMRVPWRVPIHNACARKKPCSKCMKDTIFMISSKSIRNDHLLSMNHVSPYRICHAYLLHTCTHLLDGLCRISSFLRRTMDATNAALACIRVATYALFAWIVFFFVAIFSSWWSDDVQNEQEPFSIKLGGTEVYSFLNEVITYTTGIFVVVAILGGVYEYLWKRKEFERDGEGHFFSKDHQSSSLWTKIRAMTGYQLRPLGKYSP